MAIVKPRHGRVTGKPHPVDQHVGTRVRQRRTLLGLTQTGLAKGLDLTFQQVQKYERGTNRIGSSRLYRLSRVLGVPVSYFFEEMPAEAAANSPAPSRGSADGSTILEFDPWAKRETLEFVRAFYKISNLEIRKRIARLTNALCATGDI